MFLVRVLRSSLVSSCVLLMLDSLVTNAIDGWFLCVLVNLVCSSVSFLVRLMNVVLETRDVMLLVLC